MIEIPDSASAGPALSTRARIFRVGVSWPLISLGIAVLLHAELGVAPFDVLNTGIADSSGMSFSVIYPSVAVVFYAMGWLLGARLGWASVLGTFVIGPLIGVFEHVVPEPDRLVARTAMVVAATLILATAVCLIITTELGPGPSEVFMLGLVNHRMPLVVARWISDGLPLALGALLGGAVGVGTIAITLALGPLIKIGLARLHYEPPHRPDAEPLDRRHRQEVGRS